ncbi:aftiphilin isoform X1 [Scomber scombrus]|uniref:Aftiphilin isoform X1 n=1 Tax=Scomber scombrus TaxID=13677 RepID=A0AAV1NP82_SCOSC
MESDIMPFHSSSPPPLDDDDGEVGSEEDEFGEFGGFSDGGSYSSLGFADSTEPPSRLRQPSPTIKTATRQPNSSFNPNPAEQSQPKSTGNSGSSRGQHSNTQSPFHLTNGYAEKNHISGTHTASISGACSPKEETGFADFTVFTEQAAHPWCCGFSPMSSTEQWGGGVGGTNGLGEKLCDPGHGIVMDSEPRSHCTNKARENGCTEVKHCEERDAAIVQSSQDHCQSQEAAAATAFDYPSYSRDEEQGKAADSQRKRRHHFNSVQTPEVQDYREAEEDGEDRENSVSTVPQTVSEYESATEDLGSCCDDISFECPSEDFEPNVSSLASREDQTDVDQTDAEEEELGDYSYTTNLRPSQSEAEKDSHHHCDQSATQETSATSKQSCATYTDGEFADFEGGTSEPHSDGDHAQTAEVGVQILGSLPPSDSFADFCSAPTQEDVDGSWAEFKEQRAQEEGKTWTQFREVSSLQMDGDSEEEDRMGQHRKSCQASLSCRVQQLLQASFPEVVVPAVEEEVEEEEVSSLSALFQPRCFPENDEEAIPDSCPRAQWAQLGSQWSQQDIHNAVGLRFQWGGSHTNRTLLRCLGVDTRNVVFIGMKKQPLAVPAFASSLGMLEPTKDSVPAVCSPRHTVVTGQAPPGPPNIPDPSTESMQEALPSSQLDWSRRGLSSSQDGCSALNLDYFGPEEGYRSRSSSSSRSNTPPPGVDRELYELTISKLEISTNSICVEDTMNRLLSTAEKTSTSVRKPQQNEEKDWK